MRVWGFRGALVAAVTGSLLAWGGAAGGTAAAKAPGAAAIVVAQDDSGHFNGSDERPILQATSPTA